METVVTHGALGMIFLTLRLLTTALGSAMMLPFSLIAGAIMSQVQSAAADREYELAHSATRYCPKCGRENSVESRVCPRCETRLVD